MNFQENNTIRVAARKSNLSKAQVVEIANELPQTISLQPLWIESHGDIDQKTSLRDLEKSDFFTREIDANVLTGTCRVAIHSAKDLADPIPLGLSIVAITRGQDPRDSLVIREGLNFDDIQTIATSSKRREESIKALFPNATIVDIRGTIEKRLEKVFSQEIDALIVAEAALIRLGLTHLNRILLDIPVAENQGKLAVIAHKDDQEMHTLFSAIDCRVFT